MHPTEQPGARADKPRLLLQLPQTGHHWVFPCLDHTAGHFEGEVINSVPELLYQNDFAIRSERDHIDPVVGVDDGKLSFCFADGMDELNAVEGKDAGGGEDAHRPFASEGRRNRGSTPLQAQKPRREAEEAKEQSSSQA
jgi:hypothetical protein